MVLAKKLIPYLIGFVVLLAFGWAMMKYGENKIEEEFLRKQQEATEEVVDDVSKGRENFRNSNPTRNSDLSLDRLRGRQLQD